jgi:hypothetical protein
VGFADAFEFAAGDDVEACSLLCQEAKDGEGRVGFDGVADGVGASGKGLLEELEAVGDLFGGVDVEWGAVFGGESGEVGSVAVEGAVAIDEGARIDGDIFVQEWSLSDNCVIQLDGLIGVKTIGKETGDGEILQNTCGTAEHFSAACDDCGQRTAGPGLKPPERAAFFAGLKPCAPSEESKHHLFQQPLKPLVVAAFFQSPAPPPTNLRSLQKGKHWLSNALCG